MVASVGPKISILHRAPDDAIVVRMAQHSSHVTLAGIGQRLVSQSLAQFTQANTTFSHFVASARLPLALVVTGISRLRVLR